MPMTSTHAGQLPAYLAVREIFLQQMREVFALATREEVHAVANQLKLFPGGNIVLGNDQETDCLVDWVIFQQRRQGRSLSQIAFESRGPSEPANVSAVLAGMAGATLGLFRVLKTEPGVGLQVENTWNNQSRFMFEREVSRQSKPGDHLLLRMLIAEDIAFSGGFSMSLPAPLLNAMRQEQAVGRLDSMEVIAVPGPRQDTFLSSFIAALKEYRRPSPVPIPAPSRSEKVGRNDPCPCGSGKKYKKCCLVVDEARAVPPRATTAPAQKSWDHPYDLADDDFDEMSNRIVNLIDAGQLGEAEQAARDLLCRYPDMCDGHMRLGAVYKARGERQKAAEHLRLAAALAQFPDHDHELSDSLLAEANELDPPAPK